MERVSLPRFEVAVQAVDGVGADGEDEVSLEFKVVEGGGEALWFAIYRRERASADESLLTIDPRSGAIPLPVIEWALGYARDHL
ncbi:hypothetical protein [Cellulomonas sp.]|uniref:hypothetical protein n=1 Tax=Cellulomonas sp. TaxID=40001 RepID=UPI0025854B6D|nr:hypothetical protein [Cellulomonas sp.]MCR6689359.1 hypothetical protein [Cellulomonas sp.]